MHHIRNNPVIHQPEQSLFLRVPRRLAALPTSLLSTLVAGLEATAGVLTTLGRDVML